MAVVWVCVPMTSASAHSPSGNSVWTCNGGSVSSVGTTNPGDCFAHQSGSYVSWRFYIPSYAFDFSWYEQSAIRSSFNSWTHPNGHQYYMTENQASNALVTKSWWTICGTSAAVGCTYSWTDSGKHIWVSGVDIRDNASFGPVAVHEAGHMAGVGHSAQGFGNVMGSSGLSSMGPGDRQGVCEMYGHSHAQWAGC